MKHFIALLSLTMLTFLTSCNTTTEKKSIVETKDETHKTLAFSNDQFYDSDGVFLEEKAKDALMEMLVYHDYPVFDGLREKIWLTDYNKGDYANLGLASVMFVNNEKDQYMLMDIFLLPGQMLGEHKHFAAENNPAKMEGWLIRHGKSYIAGVGEDNLSQFPQVVVPKTHWDGKVTAKHIVEANEGEFDSLAIVESAHWQMAGPEGAIITEVGNVHTNSGVLRSDPEMN
ncbi:hypothetical protein HNV08_07760 [Winogradskyella eckloniae]|uniref:hypothetical protein n=1 Tax=Winogradskyella eckloniae TaxID=1089306 RepID=UPI0015663B17|nr:hypothetical protein [Winogradskyella eckloniae]NRD19939.1 hypothetical protein [Winogradskyella eckloniae]